jgi:cytochrome P450
MMTNSQVADSLDLSFDLQSMEFIRDPYPTYHRMRATAPMYRSPQGFVAASRHEDVLTVLRDKRFSKDLSQQMIRRYGATALEQPIIRTVCEWMMRKDPPDHTRLRSLIASAFAAKRIETRREEIQRVAERMIDELIPRREIDLMKDFACRFPVIVICDLIGIPENDRDYVCTTAGRIGGRQLDVAPFTAEGLAEANARATGLADYFRQLCNQRRQHPLDDLITHLVHARDREDSLTEEELISNIILLFIAGHETVVNQIGNGLLALHRNQDQLAFLKENPDQIENAAEELLRYDTSVQLTARVATEDLRIGGADIRKGEKVMCLLGAANRDPDVYIDPDRLDLQRKDIQTMSFGGGPHFCVGAQLARLEGEVAIGTLIQRIPNLKIRNVEDPDWRNSFALRGLNKLPAVW